MNPDAVTTNHSIPHFGPAEPRRDEPAHFPGDDSPFKEPIPADVPRRAIDRKILESYDAAQERIRNISSRVTRMEAYFETIARDMRRLEDLQKEMAAHLETMVANSASAANKLAIHTEMEEYQWQVVNQANDTLAKVGAFVASVATGTSGVLYGVGAFTGGDKAASSGDSLTVSVTLTAAAS